MASYDLEREIERLRAALLPFAKKVLTRWVDYAPDSALVQVTLGECRAAQKAMAAD